MFTVLVRVDCLVIRVPTSRHPNIRIAAIMSHNRCVYSIGQSGLSGNPGANIQTSEYSDKFVCCQSVIVTSSSFGKGEQTSSFPDKQILNFCVIFLLINYNCLEYQASFLGVYEQVMDDGTLLFCPINIKHVISCWDFPVLYL